jgi:hypothetical protein
MKTLWNERFGMLLASGSPGSALAYQLGVASAESGMLRRGIATDGEAPTPSQRPEPRFGELFFLPARSLR